MLDRHGKINLFSILLVVRFYFLERSDIFRNILHAGDDFFDRFCESPDEGRLCFKMPHEVAQFMCRHADIDEWALQVKQYLKKYSCGLAVDKHHVVVIETQQFRTTTKPARFLTVLVRN